MVPEGEMLPAGMVLLSAASPVSRVNVSDETLYSWSAFFDKVEEIRKEDEWQAYLESLRSQEKKEEASVTVPAVPAAQAPAGTTQPAQIEPTAVPTQTPSANPWITG